MRDGFDGAKYVASPPLRDSADGHQERLWQGLRTNDLQVISTDHCPFCMGDHPQFGTQKQLGKEDFSKIPNGMPGVEPRFGLIYNGGVAGGRFSVNRFVELVSTTPAKMFGMYPKKGTIAIGSDADIVIFDPNGKTLVSVDTHHMAVDYSAYEGYELAGKIDVVLSKGKAIIKDDAYHGQPGDGEYLHRGTNQYLI
jgi:dihydropyrimidinase